MLLMVLALLLVICQHGGWLASFTAAPAEATCLCLEHLLHTGCTHCSTMDGVLLQDSLRHVVQCVTRDDIDASGHAAVAALSATFQLPLSAWQLCKE